MSYSCAGTPVCSNTSSLYLAGSWLSACGRADIVFYLCGEAACEYWSGVDAMLFHLSVDVKSVPIFLIECYSC